VRKLWRFLKYGPTALKVLEKRLDRVDSESVHQIAFKLLKNEVEELRTQVAALRMPQQPRELSEEELLAIRKRQIPGLTPELAEQIDWERM
jgi:hypothetical protein